jgi:hypothetical protein
MRRRAIAALAFLVAGVVGTACDSPTSPPPAVRFEVDAPFCAGTQFQIRFYIDGVVVGQDTLTDGQSSADFATVPGLHELRAQFLNAPTSREATVALSQGERYAMLLDFYCS